MSATRSTAAAMLALSIALMLSSCVTSPTPTAPTPESTTSRASDSAEPRVTDTADPTAQDEAVQVAVTAMTEFANRQRSYDEWWAGLSPYLDPAALDAYAYTDPRLVPPSAVTGAGMVAAAISSTQVTVLVPTDAGQYSVELFRQADGGDLGPWLVNSMTPPGR